MSIRRVVLYAVLLTAMMMAGCTYYQAVPATPSGPSSFDRAWNAALGAAEDVGVSVSSADRTSGIVYGTRGNQSATIRVYKQADGRVRVEFSIQGGGEAADAIVAKDFSSAYDRRMGR